MSNEKKQLKAVQGTSVSTAEKKEVIKVNVTPAIKEPGVQITPKNEALEREISVLKMKLSKIPESFTEKSKFFSLKMDLVRKYQKLEKHQEQLEELKKQLEHDCEENDFTSEKFHISLKRRESYRDEEAVKINNPVVIAEMLDFILEKINERMKDYQLQIED